MDWFRSYHGAPTDPKWRVIATRCKCRSGEVAVIFWGLLDIASQTRERGVVFANATERTERIDELSASFDFDHDLVERVIKSMETRGLIADGTLTAWEKRQPKREDGSAERAKAWRERNRTHENSNERREEQNREEQNREESPPFPPGGDTHNFTVFWEHYPHKVGKGQARTAFDRAIKKIPLPEMLAALDAYRRSKPPDRAWCNPATWLNGERWLDRPAANPTPAANGHAKSNGNGHAITGNAYGSRAWWEKVKDQRGYLSPEDHAKFEAMYERAT